MSFEIVKEKCVSNGVTLVAVSKTKPVSEIERIYQLGQRHFGENRVQEMVEKHEQLPKDIKWHQIGTLQRNKVKYIAPFVHLIHSVDTLKLAQIIIKEAEKNSRCIEILIQTKVAMEETKHGQGRHGTIELISELNAINSPHIKLRGIMAMASFTNDQEIVKAEFLEAKKIFSEVKTEFFPNIDHWDTLSMGMSGDYEQAIDCGSNMVRVGSLIFGSR